MIAALKSFLAANARFSLLILRRSLCCLIVGDKSPIPGRERILWLYEELNAEGMFRRRDCLYACNTDKSNPDQLIFSVPECQKLAEERDMMTCPVWRLMAVLLGDDFQWHHYSFFRRISGCNDEVYTVEINEVDAIVIWCLKLETWWRFSSSTWTYSGFWYVISVAAKNTYTVFSGCT